MSLISDLIDGMLEGTGWATGVAVVLGWLILHEPLSLWTLVGGLAVLAGTGLVLVPARLEK